MKRSVVFLLLIAAAVFVACGTVGAPPAAAPTEFQHFTVSNTAEWDDVRAIIAAGDHGMGYIIEITADFAVPGTTSPTFGTARNTHITLLGEGRTISLSSNGSILQTALEQVIIMDGLTLQGRAGNNAAVVTLMGGAQHSGIGSTLEMRGNSVITGNDNTNPAAGGGIFTGRYCTVIMRDNATITNNTTVHNGGGIRANQNTHVIMRDNATVSYNFGRTGGGILINTAGYLTMLDNSRIVGNTGSGSGGGGVWGSGRSIVTMRDNATIAGNISEFPARTAGNGPGGGGIFVNGNFRFAGGTIYGTDGGANSNAVTGAPAAAIFISENGLADYGRFDGDTWVRVGRITASSDTTVRVVNGVLQGL